VHRARTAPRAPAGGIDGHGRKELAQLCCRSRIEAAIGALGEPRDLAEGGRRTRIRPLLKQEHGHAQQGQLAGAAAQIVDLLLHAVANIDEGTYRPLSRLAARVAQHLANLRIATGTRNLGHQRGERVRIPHPLGGAALGGAAEVDELHIKPANCLDGLEHVGLQGKRHIPGRLAAHGGVHGKNEPAASRGRTRAELLHPPHEVGHLAIPQCTVGRRMPRRAGW